MSKKVCQAKGGPLECRFHTPRNLLSLPEVQGDRNLIENLKFLQKNARNSPDWRKAYQEVLHRHNLVEPKSKGRNATVLPPFQYKIVSLQRISPKVQEEDNLVLSTADSLKNSTVADLIKKTEEGITTQEQRDKLANLETKLESNKGGVGQILEWSISGQEPNSDSTADYGFAEGKTLTVMPTKNGYRASGRASGNMINFGDKSEWEKPFEESNFFKKNSTTLYSIFASAEQAKDKRLVENLLVDFEQLKHVKIKYKNPLNNAVETSSLYDVIKSDYEIIRNKINSGDAHRISGQDTILLEAYTKSSSSDVRRPQWNNEIPAKPRAFGFKVSYVNILLQTLITKES